MADRLYRGRWKTDTRRLLRIWTANPNTRCWRCTLTLDQHPPHKNGRRPWWTRGHIRDSDPTSPTAPEASTCNYTAGAQHGNRLRRRTTRNEPTSRNWHHTE